MDLRDALDDAIRQAQLAKAALDDEHEGNVTEAVVNLHAVAGRALIVVTTW